MVTVGFVRPESLRKDEWPQLAPDPGLASGAVILGVLGKA